MKRNSYDNFFMNFASRSKFDIILALRDGPLSVGDIAQKIGGEQSAISHNLAKMAGCRILDVRQDGKQRIYSLNEETVLPMLKIVEHHVRHCCLGRCRR